MNADSGILVTYTTKKGTTQKAKALHIEQSPAYKNHDKLLLRLLNDDLTEKLNKRGQKMVAVKNVSEVAQVGFVD